MNALIAQCLHATDESKNLTTSVGILTDLNAG